MKIAIADNNRAKFTPGIKAHWEKKHEVRFEAGASPALCQWADLYYVDDWDNNIHYLWKLYNDDPDGNRPPGWDNNKKPIFVVRPLDWTVWIGLARDQRIIDWVDKIIVIAPHIERELRRHADFGNKIRLIRPGVDLDKFTLKKTVNDGFQIGMVLGNMWWMKNHTAGLDIFTSLYHRDYRYRLHIRGQQPGDLKDYWLAMTEYILESRGIKDAVTIYPEVPDMNEWLEKIDILLHPGLKEAFCYAVGEAAAKGIPCVVNDFYGSTEIWNVHWLYQTHEDAVEKIIKTIGNRLSWRDEYYRHFIERNYDLRRMMHEYDEYLGT